jgi:methyl-accepting chemotaxis protein
MDQVTQQNAALVEEAAAAAASLQEQASGLSEVVSVFRLDQNQVSHAAAPLRRRAADAPRKQVSQSQPRQLAAAGAGAAGDWEEF